MSLINRCYNCSTSDIICENLQIMNVKIEYYDYCNDCIKKVKNILTINLLSLPIDILNIILSLITLNDTIILDKKYNFISFLNTTNNRNILYPDINCIAPLVLGYGSSHGYQKLPNEIKSFNFVNKLLQQSDIASLLTIRSILFNKRKYYKEFRKELINKNKLEYIIINLILFHSTNMILLIYKPHEITTMIKVIDYKNKNLIKTINSNEIINNNYIIDI